MLSVVERICTLPQPERQRVKVIESSLATPEMTLAVLHQIKAGVCDEVHLGWPETNILVQVGRALGSTRSPADQWLIRLVDVALWLSHAGRTE